MILVHSSIACWQVKKFAISFCRRAESTKNCKLSLTHFTSLHFNSFQWLTLSLKVKLDWLILPFMICLKYVVVILSKISQLFNINHWWVISLFMKRPFQTNIQCNSKDNFLIALLVSTNLSILYDNYAVSYNNSNINVSRIQYQII